MAARDDPRAPHGQIVVLAPGAGRNISLGPGGIVTLKAVAAAVGGTLSAYEADFPPATAGPSSISAEATIYDNEVDDAGDFIVLRDGSNTWSCFPDAPGTPDADPMCLDETWMNWLHALVAGDEPDTQVLGMAYMLSGGSDASNTDPFATGPEAGNEWIASPAHVMVIMPGEIDQRVFTTDPLSGAPFIMWAGTPYEHIMMPVDRHTMVEMGHMGSMGQMAAATPTP